MAGSDISAFTYFRSLPTFNIYTYTLQPSVSISMGKTVSSTFDHLISTGGQGFHPLQVGMFVHAGRDPDKFLALWQRQIPPSPHKLVPLTQGPTRPGFPQKSLLFVPSKGFQRAHDGECARRKQNKKEGRARGRGGRRGSQTSFTNLRRHRRLLRTFLAFILFFCTLISVLLSTVVPASREFEASLSLSQLSGPLWAKSRLECVPRIGTTTTTNRRRRQPTGSQPAPFRARVNRNGGYDTVEPIAVPRPCVLEPD